MQSRPYGYAAVSETRRCRRQFHFQEPDSQAKARLNRRSGKGRPSAGKLLSQFRLNAEQPLSALHFSRFLQKTGANASRQNRKDARGKTRAAFWLGETDDDDRAGLWHLIEVS